MNIHEKMFWEIVTKVTHKNNFFKNIFFIKLKFYYVLRIQ